jgi:Ser/Thr protein kinase RdoA (MazF antagonist)
MRLEPQFDQGRLIACAAAEYGVALRRLTYIPRGEASYSYVAEASDGATYILKVLDASRLAQITAQRMTFVLPLLHELRSKALLPNVPQPVFTASRAPVACCGECQLVLLDYVEGENPDRATLHRPDVWARLARDVAHLHAATEALESPCPEVETFEIPFETALLDGMAALAKVTAMDRPGHQALASLLLDQADTLMALLTRLKELADLARDLVSSHVLCHTDIHRWNLLIDADDVLTIIDWEGVKLAPAEHDLFAFNGDDFAAFLDAYLCAGGVRDLHAETFGFYFYRRNLEDLTDYIVRILYENDDAQSVMDVSAVASEECLASWPYIEPSIELVRRQLAESLLCGPRAQRL